MTREVGAAPLGVLLAGYDGAGTQNHQLDMYEPAFSAHPGFEIRAVASHPASPADRIEVARSAASRLGVDHLDDVHRALARPDVDVVSACVGFDQRVEVIEAAAAHRRHVLVDKPMALTIAEVESIDAIAARDGIVCMPAHHHRFTARIQRARALVDAGELGTLLGVAADFIVTTGATVAGSGSPTVWPLGELMNFVVYPVDVIRHVTGSEVARVWATRGGYFYDGPDDEDFGVLSVVLTDNTAVTISVGRAPITGHPSGGEHRYRFVGSERALDIDLKDPIAVVHRADRTVHVPPVTTRSSVAGLLDEFERAVRGGETALGPSDGRAALAVTLAARSAAESGAVVDV